MNNTINELEAERDELRARLDEAEKTLLQAGHVTGEVIVDLRREIGRLRVAIAHALTLLNNDKVPEAIEELSAAYYGDRPANETVE